jgi:glycine cleavage system H protein
MSDIPSDHHYSKEHEYLRAAEEDGVYYVGVTDYAQGELGDVVFVELPGPGDSFASMDVFGTVEAVKAVSDLYMPVGGEVLEVNEALDSDPSLVNSDPYGEGWMIKVRIADESELESLLDGTAYEDHIG